MKITTCLLLSLLLACNAFSQNTVMADTTSKNTYLTKSRNQRTGAWVCLGGGFALTAVAVILVSSDLNTP